jgi:acyl-CoA thioesterase-1
VKKCCSEPGYIRSFFIAGLGSLLLGGVAHAATVVALGASNTFGKGVSRSQAYPAQLEALLRARGSAFA